MTLRFSALCLLVGLPLLADQVVLSNGDRISGKVVKKDGGALTIKTDMMGEVTVKWENVTSVATDAPVTVVGPEGQTLQGKVATTGSQLEVADAAGTKQVPLANVGVVRDAAEQARYERFLHPPLSELWAGFFDLGLATTTGNAQTLTLTTSFNATRATNNDKINLHYNQIYAKASVPDATAADPNRTKSVGTAKAVRGGISYDRNVSPKLFVNVFNDYEYDAFQNLDLRFVAGGGLGYHLWKNERGRLDLVGGLAFTHDSYGIPIAPPKPDKTRSSADLYWGDDFAYKLSGRTSLTQSFRMFTSMNHGGDYRTAFDIGAETKLAKWLSWQVTFSDRYLSAPPTGRKANDMLLSTGVRATFSH